MPVVRIEINFNGNFPGSSAGKESSEGDSGSIIRSGRSSGKGIGYPHQYSWASLVAQVIKNLPAMGGDLGLIPGLGRCPGGRHGNQLQYSCLENPHDRGVWQATVRRIVKSQTRLSDWAHSTASFIYLFFSNVPDTWLNIYKDDII